MGQQRGRAWRRHQRQRIIARRAHMIYEPQAPTTVQVWQLWVGGEPTDVLYRVRNQQPPPAHLPADRAVGVDIPWYWGTRNEWRSVTEVWEGEEYTVRRWVTVSKPPEGGMWKCLRIYMVAGRRQTPGKLDKTRCTSDCRNHATPHGTDKRWRYTHMRSVKARRARQLGIVNWKYPHRGLWEEGDGVG